MQCTFTRSLGLRTRLRRVDSVILCCIFNILVSRLTTGNVITSTVISVFGNTAFLSMLGSRLLFNLKDAGKHGVNEGTSYRPERSLSGIEFGDAGVEGSEVVRSLFFLVHWILTGSTKVSENTLP